MRSVSLCVAGVLAGFAMQSSHAQEPSIERRGLMPIPTTRGDRFFVGLLGSAFIHLAWLGLTDLNLWWALVLSAVYMVAIMRWG